MIRDGIISNTMRMEGGLDEMMGSMYDNLLSILCVDSVVYLVEYQ